jgi:tagaturonate reductase
MPEKLNRINYPHSLQRPVKVLQFGEGNFLRAFADWIIDILNEKTDFNGSVNIVQPLPNGMGTLLNEQDGLYHVILHGIDKGEARKETRLVTCVNKVINPYESFSDYLLQAENPDLQFVISNTTEAGITFNATDESPDKRPATFPGKLTSLLYHRFKFFGGASDKGLIMLPCELIDKNGHALKNSILQYCAHWKLPVEFARWITEHNTFCNTLVDRIVPGFPADTIAEVQHDLGFEDKLVVTAEVFHLWVIEGPAHLSKVFPVHETGLQVKFVDDFTLYRTRKVRILNGAHTAMVPFAYLRGLRTVQDSVEEPVTRQFINHIVFDEIIPTLDLPVEELTSFAGSVMERFENPFIRHELSSIALNSVSKFKTRVLPSILEYRKRRGTLPEGLIKSFACLIIFYRTDWRNEKMPVNDVPEVMAFFSNAWNKLTPHVLVKQVLSNVALWDIDLTEVPGLQNAVEQEVKALLDAKPKAEEPKFVTSRGN